MASLLPYKEDACFLRDLLSRGGAENLEKPSALFFSAFSAPPREIAFFQFEQR